MFKNKKGFAALLAAVMLLILAVSATAQDAVTMTAAELEALASEGVITLENNVTVSNELSFGSDVTLDLNGYALTLTQADNDVTGLHKVTVTNGTVVLPDKDTASAGDGIIRVGARGQQGGELTLDAVTVTGNDLSSGAGTICIYANGILNLVNGAKIEINGESCTAAYAIYCNDAAGVVNITGSKVSVTDGNSGIFNGTVTVSEKSEITLDVKDNGINGGANAQKLVVDDSTLTVQAENGRALTLYGDNTAAFTNGTKVDLNSNGEAAIRYKSGTTGKVSADQSSTVTLGGDNKLVVDDEGDDPIAAEDFGDHLDIAATGDYVTKEDGSVLLCGHVAHLTKVPAKASTTTEEGNTEYYVCANCDSWFADAQAKTKITDKASVVLPKAVNPPTGDPAALLTVLALVTAAGAALLLYRRHHA